MSANIGRNQGIGDTAKGDGLLTHAAREAQERGLYDFTIVDADAHHYEVACLPEITRYIEHPAARMAFEKYHVETLLHNMIPGSLGDREVAGRVRRDHPRPDPTSGVHPVVQTLRHSMRMMGIDYTMLFPTPLLSLGLHPDVELEVALARAYSRWLVDNVLSTDRQIRAMIYLPFNDAEASLEFVEEFGDKPGVAGFMITSVRFQPVHHNKYMKVYRAIEERGLPIGFHSALNWNDRNFDQLNKFISVHALGFPFYNMIHMCNLVVNGIPERFPKLKWVFIEAGVAWLPFMMLRLDNEYMMRPSEAPQLTKKPSEYIKEFFYTTQPIERPDRDDQLQIIFDMIDAENQLLYASDYPHWDFDLPSSVYDLSFLSEQAKRKILGGNAMRLFNLPDLKAAGSAAAD